MDWTRILLAILGLVGTIDLIRVFFIKEDKKGKQIDNKDSEISALQHANTLLADQLERSHETIKRQDETISSLQSDKGELLATQACLFDDMCIHKGCRLRKPHQGQGPTWYKKYREDPSLGADYLSIDTLMKQDRAERKAIEKQMED